ncbi:hypothetical protein BJ085DRAFT_37189 [Dimargaris cristalligena]|uniref:BZIP domain-containing protein n=1 Tax=Dimargaris cristalligena TaxID=215637 RepID=A0A4Q0A0A9_9FUNG|nr:hypothetical protein BJ085DRAFT_37189 [Dimargaris cristalligena]|eukprot:RKP38692.1 hypothetical protein BJ085DRAFT_37189 [Dimargaris cristalligena]
MSQASGPGNVTGTMVASQLTQHSSSAAMSGQMSPYFPHGGSGIHATRASSSGTASETSPLANSTMMGNLNTASLSQGGVDQRTWALLNAVVQGSSGSPVPSLQSPRTCSPFTGTRGAPPTNNSVVVGLANFNKSDSDGEAVSDSSLPRSVPSALLANSMHPPQLSIYQRRMSTNGSKKIAPLCTPTLMTAQEQPQGIYPSPHPHMHHNPHMLALYSPAMASPFLGYSTFASSFSAPPTPCDGAPMDMMVSAGNKHFHPYLNGPASLSPTDDSFGFSAGLMPTSLGHTPCSAAASGSLAHMNGGNLGGPSGMVNGIPLSAGVDMNLHDNLSYYGEGNSVPPPDQYESVSNRRLSRRRERNRLAARRSREKRSQYITDLQNQNTMLHRQLLQIHQQLKACTEELNQFRRMYPSPISPGFSLSNTAVTSNNHGCNSSSSGHSTLMGVGGAGSEGTGMSSAATHHGGHPPPLTASLITAGMSSAPPVSPMIPTGLVSPAMYAPYFPQSPGFPFLVSQATGTTPTSGPQEGMSHCVSQSPSASPDSFGHRL